VFAGSHAALCPMLRLASRPRPRVDARKTGPAASPSPALGPKNSRRTVFPEDSSGGTGPHRGVSDRGRSVDEDGRGRRSWDHLLAHTPGRNRRIIATATAANDSHTNRYKEGTSA